MLGATLIQYPAWVAGTALGALAGAAFGDPNSLGLDAMFPAFFLALLAAELGSPARRKAAGGGAAITLATTPLLPLGLPILAATLAAGFGLSRSRSTAQLIPMFAPALVAALVVTETFTDARTLTIDARAAGVAAAGLGLVLRAPLVLVIVIAALTTALVRLIS